MNISKAYFLNKELVLKRLEKLASANRLTCDFDGTVIRTKRYAEGTASGYNKKHKGERSYYPLLATIAQTGQVLDFVPRAGNVHDSNGVAEFIEQTLSYLKSNLKNKKLDVAGRLTKPAGRQLLTINENEFIKQYYRAYLESLKKSA